MTNRFQDLSRFRMPPGFRGRSALNVQLWWIVQALLFHPSPQAMYGWRAFLLRCFGAKIGKNVIIRPSASVTYPWKVAIGDYSWIGDEVVLYSLGSITIGNHSVVSQRSYVCAGSHDIRHLSFTITGVPVEIGDECWIASDVFLCPGVSVGSGTVVGARSTVTRSLPGGIIAMGSPARKVGDRQPADSEL